MRIVLDTNIVLSALLWRGTPYRLLQAIRQQEHVQLYSSAVLLAELGQVLGRQAATRRLALIRRAAHEVLGDYIDAVELVTVTDVPRVVAADPDDDWVIATAVAAGADLLISGDSNLLTLGAHQGVRIVTAAKAIDMLRLAHPERGG